MGLSSQMKLSSKDRLWTIFSVQPCSFVARSPEVRSGKAVTSSTIRSGDIQSRSSAKVRIKGCSIHQSDRRCSSILSLCLKECNFGVWLHYSLVSSTPALKKNRNI